MTTHLVVDFDRADPAHPALVGGKGAGLARMTAAGLPVPPGFIITTEACRRYRVRGAVPDSLPGEIRGHLAALEARSGRTFGGGPTPLLVSVRSGAAVSMPGMMDTILNLGLNAPAAVALATATDVRFMAEVYVRFSRMFAEIVLGGGGEAISEAAAPILARLPRSADPAAVFASLADACGAAAKEEAGESIPDDPHGQLERAVVAVLESWNSRRAVTYRRFHKIPDEMGTAVVVQAMVFGNLGSPSGTGVAFSRNPLTGERELYGEFLEDAQGEDVVAGTSDPMPLAEAAARQPAVFDEFAGVAARLETMLRDVVDIEFTVERGRLYLLQVRSAKRTAEAAIRIAADVLTEGVVTPAEALARLSPDQVRRAEQPRFEDAAVAAARAAGAVLGSGVGASPGQVSGCIVVDPDRAVTAAADGRPVLLVRPTTSPQDLHGMIAATGILTAVGGATSHAAVVARALGKPCVTGFRGLEVDLDGRRLVVGDRELPEGHLLSVDGSSGEVFEGALPTTSLESSGADLARVLGVADAAARVTFYARAATAETAATVLDRGAAGIAIRLGDVLATTGRLEALLRHLADHPEPGEGLEIFAGEIAEVLTPILAAAGGAEVAVRALDVASEEAVELLDGAGLLARNPRLALPLGVPELIAVQLRGLALAAARSGHPKPPQLSVRHITDPLEALELRRLAEEVRTRHGLRPVLVGATVTSPRGAHMAAGIAGAGDVLWIEVRGIQAALYGYPTSLWLTGDPLDEYVRRGMLSGDPRSAPDESMGQLLATVAAARVAAPRCRIGLRLAGPVSEEGAEAFHRAGFRLFVVDAEEVRPARLAFGKAALSEAAITAGSI